MDITDWMWIKLGAMGALAFAWGIYCGVTGRPLSLQPPEPRDKTELQELDSSAPGAPPKAP